MCGLMGVIQNLVLASLLTTSLHHPGLLLASNLTLHTAIRFYIPSLIAYLMPELAKIGPHHKEEEQGFTATHNL
ncbi:hypothetical protein E2C01_022586 [Portunus trituberculatus]|uniref:Uncharacterized protein n=1 Tax=Portunus trituberculatus TaxID=210409 RepID=A0A5B7E6D8_PORTR|nr:hypothetical protein [Portunus trituberculatus]